MNADIVPASASILQDAILMKMAELVPDKFEAGDWFDVITATKQRRTWYGKKFDEVKKERIRGWRLPEAGFYVLLADESVAQFHLCHHDQNGRVLTSRKNYFIGGWMKVGDLHELSTPVIKKLTQGVLQL